LKIDYAFSRFIFQIKFRTFGENSNYLTRKVKVFLIRNFSH
jgi:hypothetical protein